MEEHKTRNTILLFVFIFTVLFIAYFPEIVGAILFRYPPTYWSSNTISAIFEMYDKTPCVTRVRFQKCDSGTLADSTKRMGVEAYCDMRWDASRRDIAQAYRNLCVIMSSEEFLSKFCQDVYPEPPPGIKTLLFTIQINIKDGSPVFGDAEFDIVILENGIKLVPSKPFKYWSDSMYRSEEENLA